MAIIVNLSTLHDYSIYKTVGAFAALCKAHSPSCFNSGSDFLGLKYGANYAWVMSEYLSKYDLLIKPYKLGEISTDDFLENLSEIFYFMRNMEDAERHQLLAKAWTSSIEMSDEKMLRFASLLEKSKDEPVYIVSNTNEMDVRATINLLKQCNPEWNMNDNISIGVEHSQVPVELSPNLFLCLSYRYQLFKSVQNGTPGLIKQLIDNLTSSEKVNLTMVSNHKLDLMLAKDIGAASVLEAEPFYEGQVVFPEHNHLSVNTI